MVFVGIQDVRRFEMRRIVNTFLWLPLTVIVAVALSGVWVVAQEPNGAADADNESGQSSADRDQQSSGERENQSSQNRQSDRDPNNDRSDDWQYSDQESNQRSDQQFDSRQNEDDRSTQGSTNNQQRDQNNQQRDQYSADESAALGVLLDSRGESPRVIRVFRGTPADRVGIRTGDEILALNGERIRSARQLSQRIQQMNPGERVDVRINRSNQQRTLDVRLTERDEELDRKLTPGDEYGNRGGNQSYGNQQGQFDNWDSSQTSQISRELQDVNRQLQQLANRVANLQRRLGGGDSNMRQQRDANVNPTGFYDEPRSNYDNRQADYNRAAPPASNRGYRNGEYDNEYSPQGFQGNR
jgi:membrane-associated protease RseP (regulator of RpoE activity)